MVRHCSLASRPDRPHHRPQFKENNNTRQRWRELVDAIFGRLLMWSLLGPADAAQVTVVRQRSGIALVLFAMIKTFKIQWQEVVVA